MLCIGKRKKQTSDPLNKILEAASQLNLSIGFKGFLKIPKATEFKWNMVQFRPGFWNMEWFLLFIVLLFCSQHLYKVFVEN